jgi:MoxR-like ATPase
MARSIAASMRCNFSRLQFTPDLLPADITGMSVFKPSDGSFQFVPGPVFTHILLADEINRATPKTQAALLEAMQEHSVTVAGETRKLPEPYFVLATQNPVEQEGTYPLPEAQLDRFFMKLSLGYPSHIEEIDILRRNMNARPIESIEPVASAEDILTLREERKNIICADAVLDYIIHIAEATRGDERISLGISPRGCIALTEAAMAHAMFAGRDYTMPDDVQKLAIPVLAHRLVLDRRSGIRGENRISILRSIIREIKVPAVS